MSYSNLLPNNTVSSGVRTISLQVSDIERLFSQTITIRLEVTERNDEPDARLDNVLDFVEGTSSVRILTSTVIRIMDEELNNISSINVTLTATNGELDTAEYIFIHQSRTPVTDKAISPPPFTNIYIPCEGTVSQYEEVLRAIHYVNQADEPTYYANATSREKLIREIIIELKDDNVTQPATAVHRVLVNITLINDNTPVISLNVTNSSCLVMTYPGNNGINKRSIRATTYNSKVVPLRLQRKLQVKRKAKSIIGMVSCYQALLHIHVLD